MTNENGVKVLTDMVADFVAHIGKKLPDDVVAKLEELGSQETAALPKALYETMTKNQKLAVELNRPSCQDTGDNSCNHNGPRVCSKAVCKRNSDRNHKCRSGCI